jgi:hypothetical protein
MHKLNCSRHQLEISQFCFREVSPPVPSGLEVGWAPEQVRHCGVEKKNLTTIGNRTAAGQTVAHPYTTDLSQFKAL